SVDAGAVAASQARAADAHAILAGLELGVAELVAGAGVGRRATVVATDLSGGTLAVLVARAGGHAHVVAALLSRGTVVASARQGAAIATDYMSLGTSATRGRRVADRVLGEPARG